jgi:hypothetical protein
MADWNRDACVVPDEEPPQLHLLDSMSGNSLCDKQVEATLPAAFGSLPHCPVCQRINRG